MAPRNSSSPASTDVRTRPLGGSGLMVSEIGFGTWAIGGSRHGTLGYGRTDDAESIAALQLARTLGCTLFDTANLYGWGHAESLLGEAFADCRDEIVLATKAGYTTPDGGQDFSAEAVRRSVEGSLTRLGTGYVDLLQLHNPSVDALAGNEALFAALDAMTREGLIRAFGISARTPDDALLFATRYAPASLQINFNLADARARRNGLFDLCRGRGIAIVVRTPLAAGFLTGQLAAGEAFAADDHRSRYDDTIRGQWIDAVRRLAPVFDDGTNATAAQNAIRYCLSFDAVSAVIPGMMRESDVREDLASSALPPLDAAQLEAIDAIYDEVFG